MSVRRSAGWERRLTKRVNFSQFCGGSPLPVVETTAMRSAPGVESGAGVVFFQSSSGKIVGFILA